MGIVKQLLIFPMAALDFAIVPGCIYADVLVVDTEFRNGFLKQCGNRRILVVKPVGKHKAIVGLNMLNIDTATGEKTSRLSYEIR